MAMQFILPPAGTDLTPETALENLRLGYMVDRFTGAAIDRTIAGQAGAVSTVTGDINNPDLTIQSNRDVATTGSYHISDRIIEIGSGRLLATANGVHISFYNCTFVVTNFDANAPTNLRFAIGFVDNAGNGTGRTTSSRVADGAASTRSINFYGCTVAFGSTLQRTSLRCQFSDAIGSDFRFAGHAASNADIELFPSPQTGGRWINSRFVAAQQRTTSSSRLFTYGFPDVYEGIELYGLGIDVGLAADAVAGPRMLIEPNFSFPGQDTVYTFQSFGNPAFADGPAANLFQNVGFFTPASNANNDGGNVIAPRSAGYLNLENGAGGAVNYVAYQPTYTDAVTGNGIENVRVRVNTSVTLNAAAGATTTAANFPRRVNTPDSDQTIGTTGFIGSEYLTDTTGQLVSSMRTDDGWSTSVAGYYDPMIFDFRTDTTTNPGRLAQNSFTTPVLTPPEHTALAAIQDIRGVIDNNSGNLTTATFTRHEAQYQAFSWSHDIRQELEESSTTLIDGTARGTQTDYGINRDVSVAAPSIIGTFVKSGYTASDNTPNLTALQGLFDQDDTPSINDVRMAIRYARYQYEVMGNPQTTRTNLTVDNSHGTQWTVTEVSGGYNTVVRGAGLAADTATDLYTGDPFLGTVDMDGNPITGLSLGDSLTRWSGLRTGAAQTDYAVQGGAISGTYTSASGGDIYFDGVDISGLSIVVSSGTLNIRGTRPDGVALSASDFTGRITGTANFPAPVVTLTVNTPDEAGYFGVLNVTQNTVVTLEGQASPGAISTGGGTVGSFEIPSGSTDTFRFYWKRRNDAATGYSTTIIERSNTGLTMSMSETMEATPLIATLYSGDTGIGRANVAAPVTGSRAASFNGMRILVNNDSTTTGAASQFHILTGMDSTEYIDVLANNARTADVIAPDSISSSVSNAQFIQIDTATPGEQQQLVGTQFNNLEPGQPEALRRSIFPFVTSSTQLTDRDRFYILDPDDNFLQDSDRWPGQIGSSAQVEGSHIVFVDQDESSLMAQDIRALIDRNVDLTDVLGTIDVRDSANTVRANFTFTGITVTAGVFSFNLTAYNTGGTQTLADQGISSGNIATSLSGVTRTGTQTDQVVTITEDLMGGGTVSFPSVTLFPNPAGATPAQIEQAAANAVNSSTSIAQTRNGVGYLIGTGGDSRLVGIKPRATNYDSTQPYGDNL